MTTPGYTEDGFPFTPQNLAAELQSRRPDLEIEYGNTGGGIMCLVAHYSHEDEAYYAGETSNVLYFGTAEGFLGWSNYDGDRHGSNPHHVATSRDNDAWQANEPLMDTRPEVVIPDLIEILNTELPPVDLSDPETVRTCADKALTLIEMSEVSDVLEGLQNLDQLAERVDWNHFLAEACDHVEQDQIGTDWAITHLNAVNVAADQMIQAHPRAEYPLTEAEVVGEDHLSANPGDILAEAWVAVHAQLEDLTPIEGLEVLRRVRADLIEQTIQVALDEHFAAPEPIEGLRAQLDEYGLQITEKE